LTVWAYNQSFLTGQGQRSAIQKRFSRHSTTNHFSTKISSELATFGTLLAYKIHDSTMTTFAEGLPANERGEIQTAT